MLVDLTVNPEEIKSLREMYEKYGDTIPPEKFYPFISDNDEVRAFCHPHKGCYIACEYNSQPSANTFVETIGRSITDMGYLTHEDNPSIIEDENGEWIPNPKHFEQWGVCDNVQQVLDKWGDILESDEHKYFIWFSPVFQDKENAWQGGGWRWHKWGEYIGTLEPRCEYLDDEDFPDDWQGYVLCYHIFRIDAKGRK